MARVGKSRGSRKSSHERGFKGETARHRAPKLAEPHRSRQATGSASQPIVLRKDTPPKNQLDANDRLETRATESEEQLTRRMRFERHRNTLAWHETLRNIVFFGGVSALTVVLVFALKTEGLSTEAAYHVALAGMIGGMGGYGLRNLFSKILQRSSSRDERGQSRPDFEDHLPPSDATLLRRGAKTNPPINVPTKVIVATMELPEPRGTAARCTKMSPTTIMAAVSPQMAPMTTCVNLLT